MIPFPRDETTPPVTNTYFVWGDFMRATRPSRSIVEDGCPLHSAPSEIRSPRMLSAAAAPRPAALPRASRVHEAQA